MDDQPELKIEHHYDLPTDHNPNELVELQDKAEKNAQAFEQAKAQEDQSAELMQSENPFQQVAQQGERLNELAFEMPDGTVVEMGRPNIVTSVLENKIVGAMGLGVDSPIVSSIALAEVKAIFYVKSINGQSIARPTNITEYQALINKLGEEIVTAVTRFYVQHFYNYKPEEIKIVKKS